MSTLFVIVVCTIAIALTVLFTTLFAFIKKDRFEKVVVFLVALSAGSLLGGAFLHLLPEAGEFLDLDALFGIFLTSFVSFLIIEKIIHWHHCHVTGSTIHPLGYINLVGDSIHNFIDGLVIAGAFIVDIKIGFATTIAFALHEIPHKIGDYGVLIYSGFAHRKALLLNFVVSLSSVLGGIIGFFAFQHIETVLPYLMPVAAGGFAYIASSDLVPEIKQETGIKKSMSLMLVFIAGILIMFLMKYLGVN